MIVLPALMQVSQSAVLMDRVPHSLLSFLAHVSVTQYATSLEIVVKMWLSLDAQLKKVCPFICSELKAIFFFLIVPQTFPYIDLGGTPGVATEIVDTEGFPSIIDIPFPFLFSLESTITVSFNISQL